jgi:hypothetical protein
VRWGGGGGGGGGGEPIKMAAKKPGIPLTYSLAALYRT